MSSILEALRDALLISSTDRHFAKEMGRLGGEDRPIALAAIALASRETALGHTCLAVERLTRADAWGDVSKDFRIPDMATLQEVLGSSPLVGTPPRGGAGQPTRDEDLHDTRPMVLDAAGRLYLRRYWDFQQRLAGQLSQRVSRPASPPEFFELHNVLKH